MKTLPLFALPAPAATGLPTLLVGGGRDDFLSKLTLGQIISARVLRSYEGQRYLLAFEGGTRVVDSSVPLRPAEVIQGRVVGLGERIELQKLAALGVAATDEGANDAATWPAAQGCR